jgi:REP element-mobilizing transposase RayT
MVCARIEAHRGASKRIEEGGGSMPTTKKKLPKLGTQLSLARTGGVGGRRKGAGRKPAENGKRNVPHRKRPRLDGKNHPVHVTVRVGRGVGVPSLRCEVVRALFLEVLRETAGATFHVPHHSLQHDHVHLLVEARDAKALSSGMSRLVIRFAKRLNNVLGRKGGVWSGRYHRHDLSTPTEAAHCLAYVLMNGKKHGLAARDASWLDEFSSAAQFEGWSDVEVTLQSDRPPRTWLLRIGYRRARLAMRTTMAPKAA